jgi:two-component system NtrC family response regulator
MPLPVSQPKHIEQVVTDEKPKLLVVEDDVGLQKQLQWCFDEYEVIFAATRSEAVAQLRRHEPPVVLQDLGLPPDGTGVEEGMKTLQEILSLAPLTKVIVVTGNNDRDNALRAIALGAHDFYQKPVDVDLLRLIVGRAFNIFELEEQNRRLREMRLNSTIEGLIVTDDAMMNACRIAERIGPTDVSVLICGESGTGKELLARAIHAHSQRNGQFVAINCAAIPERLLERELFGFEGRTGGAQKSTAGRIAAAEGGTLFLDEVGDLPLSLQRSLLRLIQDRVVERLGGQEIPVNVRVVCATTRDLAGLVSEQRFREDLFFRIGETTITIPPLRERTGAASVLAHAMLRKFSALQRRPKRGFTAQALAAIDAYSWPGNARELENCIKRAMVMADGPMIAAGDLGLPDPAIGVQSPFNLKEVRSRAEKQAIGQALAVTDGNISRTAELLGISRPTLYDLMEKYEIRVGE